MGLAAGGLMRQEISEDEYELEVWDTRHTSRCFLHLLDSHSYCSITDGLLPHPPITQKEYIANGLPWFDRYSDKASISSNNKLSDLLTVSQLANKKGKHLWDNDSMNISTVTNLSSKKVTEF
jgi:hypothetical protein